MQNERQPVQDIGCIVYSVRYAFHALHGVTLLQVVLKIGIVLKWKSVSKLDQGRSHISYNIREAAENLQSISMHQNFVFFDGPEDVSHEFYSYYRTRPSIFSFSWGQASQLNADKVICRLLFFTRWIKLRPRESVDQRLSWRQKYQVRLRHRAYMRFRPLWPRPDWYDRTWNTSTIVVIIFWRLCDEFVPIGRNTDLISRSLSLRPMATFVSCATSYWRLVTICLAEVTPKV